MADTPGTYLGCDACRDYWRRRASVIVRVIEGLGGNPDERVHRYRLAVHARHKSGLPITETPSLGCCANHIPGRAGVCCDPDDCVPCCRNCPTCPEHKRRVPARPGRVARTRLGRVL